MAEAARARHVARRVTRVVVCLVAVIGMAMALSCVTTGCTALEEWNQDTPSPTGGITMSLSIARPSEQAYELYRVTRNGDLEFGGGLRAFNDTTTWSGAMSTEEIASFLVLLEETGWCDTEPPNDRESTVRVRIDLRCAERRRTWTFRGAPESVERMRNLLDPISRRRFESELDRLPEASENRPKSTGTTP